MKKCTLWFAISLVLLSASECKREGMDVPDEVLAGLHKPVIREINPKGILFHDTDFVLRVYSDYLQDDSYTLYINDKQYTMATPNYWRWELSWTIPKALISELLASSPDGVTCAIRISSIGTRYDISGDFEKYRGYVSEPAVFEIKKGETQFSAPVKMFPEWKNSINPILRCDRQGNLYLAWREYLNPVHQAFFSFSRDSGANWSQVLNVSRSGIDVAKVDLAVDEANHFFMAWSENIPNSDVSDVYFSRSLDGGVTWFNPKKMNATGESAWKPVIAVDERGGIFMAWRQRIQGVYSKIVLVDSGTLGNSWRRRSFATANEEPADFDGDLLLMCGTNGEVYFSSGRAISNTKGFYFYSSTDNGESWHVKEVLTGNQYPFRENALGRAGSGPIFLAWGDSNTTGHNNNYWVDFMRGDNSGESWSEIQSLGDVCQTLNNKSAMASLGERIDMVMTGGGSLFLIRSSDGGRNWTYPEFIPGTDFFSSFFGSPDMVLHPSGKTFLVCEKQSSATDGGLYLLQMQ